MHLLLCSAKRDTQLRYTRRSGACRLAFLTIGKVRVIQTCSQRFPEPGTTLRLIISDHGLRKFRAEEAIGKL